MGEGSSYRGGVFEWPLSWQCWCGRLESSGYHRTEIISLPRDQEKEAGVSLHHCSSSPNGLPLQLAGWEVSNITGDACSL